MDKRFINIEVDTLTNSIENRITGDSFDTHVLEIEKSDLPKLKTGWSFNWIKEYNSKSTVYKLIIEKNTDIIQGLISLTIKEGFIFHTPKKS